MIKIQCDGANRWGDVVCVWGGGGGVGTITNNPLYLQWEGSRQHGVYVCVCLQCMQVQKETNYTQAECET